MFTEPFSITGASGTWARNGLIRVIRYDEGAATGGAKATIRVRSAGGSKFDFELNPGRTITLQEPANGILINNISGGADIVGKLTYGDGSVTDDSVLGSVDINAATINALLAGKYNVRPEAATANFKSVTALAATTPDTLVTPGANVSGILVLSASTMNQVASGSSKVSLIAKNAAPTTNIDGEVLMMSGFVGASGSTNFDAATLPGPVFVPAGLGLYYISDAAQSVGARVCRWKLL